MAGCRAFFGEGEVQRVGRKLGAIEPEQLDRVLEGLNEILGA